MLSAVREASNILFNLEQETGPGSNLAREQRAIIKDVRLRLDKYLKATPAEPTVPVQDAEVGEIEKRHGLYEERRARAPSDRDYMDCLVMHGHRATLLRKLRAQPDIQDAEVEREVARLIRLGEIQQAMPDWDDASIPDSQIDIARPAARMILNYLRKLRASAVPATVNIDSVAAWLCDHYAQFVPGDDTIEFGSRSDAGKRIWRRDADALLASGLLAGGQDVADEHGQTEADYAELGREFFEEYNSKQVQSHLAMDGYICADSPVEIICHLLNAWDEKHGAPSGPLRTPGTIEICPEHESNFCPNNSLKGCPHHDCPITKAAPPPAAEGEV